VVRDITAGIILISIVLVIALGLYEFMGWVFR